MKLSKKYKYIIFKLSDDFKEIVIEEASDDKDWDNFREKLIKSTTKNKSVSSDSSCLSFAMKWCANFCQGVVGKGCRYAVYDFEYSLATGDGVRYALFFFFY